ncbi:hypothetical protein OA868_01165 [Candidatus Pelagibacter sp.]|nr:hypothetical protein [Candidatus Pelagibacter sp.]
MKYIFQNIKLRNLYIFFLLLALLNIFFSTGKSYATTFSINEVELSRPFEINFNKNKIIDKGFLKAFNQLIFSIVQSKDQKKLKKTSLNEIKGMIETFSIKEEKFIDEVYYIKLNVSFNKKKIFNLLEKKNIFPALPIKKKIVFMPIIFDVNKNQVKMFSENIIFRLWKSNIKKYDLLNYILPTEDLEDLNLIKKNKENLENFEFIEIVKKYQIENYIIAIFFKETNDVKLLSKISFNNRNTLLNSQIKNINFNQDDEINKLIENLKIKYEDHWKSQNEINTSVKLPLTISIENNNNIKIYQLEETLSKIDLIYDYYIYKFDNKNNIYKIIFNGTPDKFLEVMKKNNYEIVTQSKVWILK